jgi:hypothetical protein
VSLSRSVSDSLLSVRRQDQVEEAHEDEGVWDRAARLDLEEHAETVAERRRWPRVGPRGQESSGYMTALAKEQLAATKEFREREWTPSNGASEGRYDANVDNPPMPWDDGSGSILETTLSGVEGVWTRAKDPGRLDEDERTLVHSMRVDNRKSRKDWGGDEHPYVAMDPDTDAEEAELLRQEQSKAGFEFEHGQVKRAAAAAERAEKAGTKETGKTQVGGDDGELDGAAAAAAVVPTPKRHTRRVLSRVQHFASPESDDPDELTSDSDPDRLDPEEQELVAGALVTASNEWMTRQKYIVRQHGIRHHWFLGVWYFQLEDGSEWFYDRNDVLHECCSDEEGADPTYVPPPPSVRGPVVEDNDSVRTCYPDPACKCHPENKGQLGLPRPCRPEDIVDHYDQSYEVEKEAREQARERKRAFAAAAERGTPARNSSSSSSSSSSTSSSSSSSSSSIPKGSVVKKQKGSVKKGSRLTNSMWQTPLQGPHSRSMVKAEENSDSADSSAEDPAASEGQHTAHAPHNLTEKG